MTIFKKIEKLSLALLKSHGQSECSNPDSAELWNKISKMCNSWWIVFYFIRGLVTTVNNLNVNPHQGITIILGCFSDFYISIPKLFRDCLLSNYLKGLRVTEPSSNVKSDPCTIFHLFGLSVQWSWLLSKCPRLISGLGYPIHEVQTFTTRFCELTSYA